MSTNQVKSSFIVIELLTHSEGNYCCKVASEVILAACFKLPVLYFLELLKTILVEVVSEPSHSVVRRDGLVDELDKTVG